VLAGRERVERPLDVERVRQRDVDRVDVRIGEQRLIAPVRPLDAARVGVRPRTLAVAARDRERLDAVDEPQAREDLVVDPRGRQQAEADGPG
jgi:hypothetical protein